LPPPELEDELELAPPPLEDAIPLEEPASPPEEDPAAPPSIAGACGALLTPFVAHPIAMPAKVKAVAHLKLTLNSSSCR